VRIKWFKSSRGVDFVSKR